MDSLIATARSNKVATTLGVRDFSQLRKDYGKEQPEVIMNITGNVISRQVTETRLNSYPNALERLCRIEQAILLTVQILQSTIQSIEISYTSIQNFGSFIR